MLNKDSVDQKALNEAIALHQAGHWNEALARYHDLLKKNPSSPELQFWLGTLYFQQNHYAQAGEELEKAVKQAPQDWRYQHNLSVVLRKLNHVGAALQHARQAIQLNPHPDEACFENAGALELQWGGLQKAIQYLSQSLAINPQQPDTALLLSSAYKKAVPAWHFRMLNDTARNEAFAKAITRHVTSQTQVLEIGTGAGLLAMIAAKAGAACVNTCEQSPILAEKAKSIIASHQLADKITVIPASSFELTVGQAPLLKPADCLIAEIFDSSLIGENAFPTLLHARTHLLTPGARIIPQAAHLEGILIESEEIMKEWTVNTVLGFDMRAFNEFSPKPFIMAYLPQYEFTPLSDPIPLLSFNFKTDPLQPQRKTQVIIPKSDGKAHGIVYWFSLELDEHIRYDTNPFGKKASAHSHWLPCFQAFKNVHSLSQGNPCSLQIAQYDQYMEFSLI